MALFKILKGEGNLPSTKNEGWAYVKKINDEAAEFYVDYDSDTRLQVGKQYNIVSATEDGIVPKFDAVKGRIDSSTSDWVLTNNNGTLGWYRLPTNALKNTTYTLSGTASGDTWVTTLTPSSGNATESIVPAATAAAAGLMTAADKVKLNAIPADATNNIGDITSISAGIGLAGGATSGDATIKANLRSETKLTIDSAAATTTSGRVYPVAADKSGYLAVNVPWSDTDTGATSVEITGTGNAITEASYDSTTRKLTLTKGATYSNNSGDITGVTAGKGLTGGATSGTAILNVGAGTGIIVNDNDIAVNTGFATSDEKRNYAVQSDDDGSLYVNVPWTDTNTDTHYITKIFVGSSGTAQNEGTAVSDPYIKVADAINGTNTYRNQIQIKGNGATTVKAQSGVITINTPVQNIFSGAGTSGLVPQPTKGQEGYYLRGDGTWFNLTGMDESIQNTFGALQKAWKEADTSLTSTLTTLINGKAQTNHASTGTSYGVASASNYGHAKASSTTPKASAATAAVGSETASFARGDHIHPLSLAHSWAGTTLTTEINGISKTVNIPTATTSVAGLMTADMVTKLNGIATGANKITIDSTLSTTSTNPVQNKIITTAINGKADLSEGAIFVQGSGTSDSTAKTSTWLGTSDKITAYYDGLTIRYKIGVAGQSTTTLNINGLGAKTVYRFSDSKLTTHFPVNSIIHLIYHADLNGGCWMCSDYDANTNTYQRVYPSTGNAEYPITTRYATTRGANYYAEYGRYSTGVTLNPSTNTITASHFKGLATKATADASGNVITNTYATKAQAITGLSVSGKVITYTKGDGTTDTITTQDTVYTHPTTAGNKHIPAGGSSGQILRWSAAGTAEWGADNNTTYTAGTGLLLNGTTFNHSNSITAGSVGSAQSPSHGGTFAIPKITYDAQGHITGATTVNITLPGDNNTDTQVTQNVTTSNAAFPLLLAPSGQTKTTTTTSYFDSGVTLNPSTNTIAANISGNASTATSLATPRAINGTNFDGSAAITTAKWGTARTLTVGNKQQRVDGSGNVSWGLHDILYSGGISSTSSWDITNPGVYYVAPASNSTAYSGTGNPETNTLNNGTLYRWGQLIVSKADNGGLAQFYIAHQDSTDHNRYGIHFRTGWNNSYLGTWRVLLDSVNYTNWCDGRYVNISGDTLTGALNFKNGTWNNVGDDAAMGDCNQVGMFGIKGLNGATGIYFTPYSGSTAQKISIDGSGTMTITGTVASTFSGNLSGNASTATSFSSARSITLSGAVVGTASSNGASGWSISTSIAEKSISASNFTTTFRTQTKGDANNGPYLSVIRTDTTDTWGSMPIYGSGIAFGRWDTHSYLYTNYNTAHAFIGGGNGDKLNWVKQIAFTDGTGATGTWGINITGSAGSVAWGNVTGKPSTFTPSSHNHAWGDITGKPSTFAPSSHSHDYLPLSGGTITGNVTFASKTSTVSPVEQRIVINGVSNDSTVANAPGIGFHIPNITWGSLKFCSDGSFRFYNNACSAYMPLYASRLNIEAPSGSVVVGVTNNAVGKINLQVSDSGNRGIYNSTAEKWLIYSGSDNITKVPANQTVSVAAVRNIKIIAPGTAVTPGSTAIPTGEIWMRYEN